MDDSMIGGKPKSNKDSILRNWKGIKQSIEPLDFIRELDTGNFLSQSDFGELKSKHRSHQATVVLIKVYRKIQSSEMEYQKFVEILRHSNSSAADALSHDAGGTINKPGITVDQHLIEQTRDHLKRFEKKIKEKLKKNPYVVLEITDNFIECGILDIDNIEKILHSPKDSLKKAAQLLVEFAIANIHLGAYNGLLETFKSDKQFKGLVSDLTTAGVGEDINTATKAMERKHMFAYLSDTALLRKNIIKHIKRIVDEVDLEDIKEKMLSRCDLHGDVVEELYGQYPEGSKKRIVAMIVDILGLGDSTVFMFIDVLMNSGFDASLLKELFDIRQVSDDIDSMDDNVTSQTCNLTPDMIDRVKAKLSETDSRLICCYGFLQEERTTTVHEGKSSVKQLKYKN